MPYKKYKQYLKHIDDNLKKFEGKTVTVNEYIAMQYFLSDVDKLEELVQEARFVDTKMFAELVKDFEKTSAYCKKNPKTNKITKVQIEAFFDTLDLDGSGKLEHNEILGVLKERQLLG
jgi:Ca2+-binding EF-hand superfamily protein